VARHRLGGGPEAAAMWLICFQRIPASQWIHVQNLRTKQTYHHPEMPLPAGQMDAAEEARLDAKWEDHQDRIAEDQEAHA
jgi:hypothetical protein